MQETIKQRIKAVTLALFIVFPCLLARLFYVQILAHGYYSQEASRNLDQYRDITPRRGAIYDRNNYLLVKTAPQYDILICPAKVNDESLANISQLLEIPLAEIQERVEKQKELCRLNVERQMHRYGNLPPNKYARLKKGVERDHYNRRYSFGRNIGYEKAQKLAYYKKDWEIVNDSKIKVTDRFTGFEIDTATARQYPWKTTLINVLGSIGAISEGEYRSREKDYRINDTVGRRGLESYWEEQLRGRRGCYVDSREGYVFTEPPTDGSDLVLAIDAQLQNVAEQALDKMLKKTPKATGGAAVLLEIASGDILVMATAPRTTRDVENPERADENRAVRNYYSPSPGSVFKVMVGLYALEKKIIDQNYTCVCEGYFDRSRPFEFRCTHQHGEVNIVKAIEGSCNVFFYHLGQKMGEQHLLECARLFGYGEKTQVELPEEHAGDIPDSEREWQVGRCRMFAIGQIFSATPLQVANAMAMFANKGNMPGLRLVRECRSPQQRIFAQPEDETGEEDNQIVTVAEVVKKTAVRKSWQVEHENWASIVEGMRLVTEGEGGTAVEIVPQLAGIRIGSKTGTAQVSGPFTFYLIDFKNNMINFFARLRKAEEPLVQLIRQKLTADLLAQIDAASTMTPPPLALKEEVRAQMNKLLRSPLYTENLFAQVRFRDDIGKLTPYLSLYPNLDRMPAREYASLPLHIRKSCDRYRDLVRLNHALLEDAFPAEFERSSPREDHAWFAGFAPLYAPRYVFAVFVEHGGYGGKAAAPVAAEMLRAVFDKEQK